MESDSSFLCATTAKMVTAVAQRQRRSLHFAGHLELFNPRLFERHSSPDKTHIDEVFDTGNNTNTGFGSSSSPFSQNRSTFGAPQQSAGGLFGGGTTTNNTNTGFGGFGGNNNANNSSTGGGLFGGGANKPAFGAGTTTGGGLFGGSGSTGGGFGQPQNTNAFGGATGSALGPGVPESQGTGSTPFQATTEKEGTGSQTNHFQSISCMLPYKNYSTEVCSSASTRSKPYLTNAGIATRRLQRGSSIW